MRISFEAVTTALGPGRRYAIWVQGCEKRCSGCINPAGWDKAGGTERSVSDLFAAITQQEGLTGITISGGEPFLQFEELQQLICEVTSKTGLDVMVYSGYTVEQLRERHGADFDTLKDRIDILVDGEYIREQNSGSMYRGSDNQRIFFFTGKYRDLSEKILASKQRDFSFRILDNGEVYFIGIPPAGFYETFLSNLGG